MSAPALSPIELAAIAVAPGAATTEPNGSVAWASGSKVLLVARDGFWVNPAGTPGAASWTEAEIDFGTKPVRAKSFSVVDASSVPGLKVAVLQSGNPGTGRGIDDAEWDSITYAAVAESGTIRLNANASGGVAGKRKILYQFAA